MWQGEDSITVTGAETAGEVAAAFAKRRSRQALARCEIRQDAAERAAIETDVTLKQVMFCNHLAAMKLALDSGQRATVMWIAKLGRLADEERMVLPFNAISKALLARGYAPDSRPERPTSAYHSDMDAMALYVIGHALDRMMKGMRPHPLLAMMAERYEIVRDQRAAH